MYSCIFVCFSVCSINFFGCCSCFSFYLVLTLENDRSRQEFSNGKIFIEIDLLAAELRGQRLSTSWPSTLAFFGVVLGSSLLLDHDKWKPATCMLLRCGCQLKIKHWFGMFWVVQFIELFNKGFSLQFGATQSGRAAMVGYDVYVGGKV